METPNADYFTALPAERFTGTDWDQLVRRLASGERVMVHYTVWCRLAATEDVRSVSRAGIIVSTDGMLVRLSNPERHRPWIEALPTPPGTSAEPGHEHSIAFVELPDGWEVLRCTRCGAEW